MLENIKSARIFSVVYVVGSESNIHNQFDHNLAFYELVYKLSGECITTLNEVSVKNDPYSIELLPKGNNNSYYVDIKEKGDCIDIFFETDADLPSIIEIQNFYNDEKLKSMFMKINNLWNNKADGWYYKSMSMFYDILNHISQKTDKYVSNKHYGKIEEGVEYLKEHYCDDQIDYTYPAKICNISYTYFKRIFASIYSVPPVKFVRNLRMQKARELLKTNYYSVTDVANLCGFNDLYFFSKCFKAHYGVSPKNYMKN